MLKQLFYTVTAKKRGASKSRIILIIGLSVLGAVALLCFSVYCFWFRKRTRRGRGKGDFLDQHMLEFV